MKFGRLTVIDNGVDLKDGNRTVVCKCDCGNIKTIRYKLLKNGSSKSCGCLCKESFIGRKFPNRKYEDNICSICEKQYIPNSTSQKTCSEECSKIHTKKKLKNFHRNKRTKSLESNLKEITRAIIWRSKNLETVILILTSY